MPFERISIPKAGAKVKPLDVKCTSTSCGDNLHCFKATKKLIAQGNDGQCRDCGTEIVDWERIRKRDLSDSDYTFQMLNHELIRNVFCLSELSERTIRYGLRKGRHELRETARKVLLSKVGGENNYREGYQTPKTGNNIIHYAQHATASCCRKCMEYWHGIPMGTKLEEADLNYCIELIMTYIEERLKDRNLLDERQKLPRIKKSG